MILTDFGNWTVNGQVLNVRWQSISNKPIVMAGPQKVSEIWGISNLKVEVLDGAVVRL